MYKETLDALLEGIDNHTPFKRALLENQIRYHFVNKNEINIDILNDSLLLVRRIINTLTINELIGIQTLNTKDPKVKACGIKYDVMPVSRPLLAMWTIEALEDIKKCGLDMRCELLAGMSSEITQEITSEIINKISQVGGYAGTIEEDFNNAGVIEIAEMVKDTTISNAKKVDGNWIIISPTILSMLQFCKNTTYEQNEDVSLNGSLVRVGTLDETIKVYSYAFLGETDETVLIGSKIKNREDTPIVYAPETMVMPQEQQTPNGVGTVWNFMTRYKLFVEPVAADAIYRKIKIKM